MQVKKCLWSIFSIIEYFLFINTFTPKIVKQHYFTRTRTSWWRPCMISFTIRQEAINYKIAVWLSYSFLSSVNSAFLFSRWLFLFLMESQHKIRGVWLQIGQPLAFRFRHVSFTQQSFIIYLYRGFFNKS